MLEKRKSLNAWDRVMMAITFAEAGEVETARDLMQKRTGQQRPRSSARKNEQKRPELRV